MRPVVVIFVLLNIFCASAQSLPDSQAIIYINGNKLNVSINTVIKRTIITKTGQAIYLKIVDSLETSSKVLLDAVNKQGIIDPGIKKRGDKTIIDFTRAYFPVFIPKKSASIIYRSVNFSLSSLSLHNFDAQLLYSPAFYSNLVFSIGLDIGANTVNYDDYAFSIKHSLGYTFTGNKIHFIPMLVYSQKHQYKTNPVSYKNVDTWSVNMLFHTNLDTSLDFLFGLSYWIGNKRDINNDIFFITFFTGIGIKLDE